MTNGLVGLPNITIGAPMASITIFGRLIARVRYPESLAELMSILIIRALSSMAINGCIRMGRGGITIRMVVPGERKGSY